MSIQAPTTSGEQAASRSEERRQSATGIINAGVLAERERKSGKENSSPGPLSVGTLSVRERTDTKSGEPATKMPVIIGANVAASIEAHAIMRLPTVLAVTGVKRSSIYNLMKAGKFPQCVKLTTKLVGWRSSEVAGWLEARTAA